MFLEKMPANVTGKKIFKIYVITIHLTYLPVSTDVNVALQDNLLPYILATVRFVHHLYIF